MDVDIYGDLYADVPKSAAPAASPPAKAVASSAPAGPPPVMSPPTRSPPRQKSPVLSYEAYEPPSPRTETFGATSNGYFTNKVWVAPGVTASPTKVRDPRPVATDASVNYAEGLVVDAGEVVSGSVGRGVAGSGAPRPESFEALQQEMLAEEQPAPSSPGVRSVSSKSPAKGDADEETEPSDDDLIVLGEVKASETAAKPAPAPRRWTPRKTPPAHLAEFAQIADRREVSLYIGPPPPVPHGVGTCDCFVLVGGLPWWFSDTELRRHAEQFGQIRSIRILDYPRSGKSTGIALLEYVAPDSAQRAAQPREGFSALPAWESIAVAPPRVVMVSRELLQMLRAGSLPWPDGGMCRDDLRSILMRQFGQEHIPPPRDRSRGRHHDSFRDISPRAQRRRVDDTSRLERKQSGCRGSPEPEKPVRDQVGWADKLKKLSGNVNKRPEADADMEKLASLARKVNRRC